MKIPAKHLGRMMAISDNARQAALIFFGDEAGPRLDKGWCPRCSAKRENYRDDASRRESYITGLCQKCQDFIFGKG